MTDAQVQYPVKNCGCGCGEKVIITGLGEKIFTFVGDGADRQRVYFIDQNHSALWFAKHDPAQLQLPMGL